MSTIRLLTLVLVAQLALALLTWWPEDRSAYLPHPLFEIAASDITRVMIARKPSGEDEIEWLQLTRQAEGAGESEGWRVESESGYPADAAKVDALIDKLVGLKVKVPIATRVSSHNSLAVGETDYGKRVRLSAGERSFEIVLGAAGSNSTNVRLAEDDDVYVASGLAEWSIREDARSYWQASYVDIDPASIAELRIENANGSIFFRRLGVEGGGEGGEGEREGDGKGWAIDGLDELMAGSVVNPDAIDEFVGKLSKLRISAPAGQEVLAEHGLNAPVRVSWTLAAENESVGGGYAVGAEDGSDTFVKSDTSPFVVKVSSASVAELISAELNDFVTTAEPGADAEGAGDDGGA